MNEQLAQYQPIVIDSAETIEPEIAPTAYRPHWDNGPVFYDDELDNPVFLPAWRRFFAGDSNRRHWVLIDEYDSAHFVEQEGFGGTYLYSGPERSDSFRCAYDAFYTAEQEAGVFTDPTTTADP